MKREDITKTSAAKKRKVTGIWLLIFIIIQYIYNLLILVDASDSEDEDDEEVKWVWAGDSKKGSQDVWVCPSLLLLYHLLCYLLHFIIACISICIT